MLSYLHVRIRFSSLGRLEIKSNPHLIRGRDFTKQKQGLFLNLQFSVNSIAVTLTQRD